MWLRTGVTWISAYRPLRAASSAAAPSSRVTTSAPVVTSRFTAKYTSRKCGKSRKA